MGGEKSAVFVSLCLKEQTTVEKVDQIKDFLRYLRPESVALSNLIIHVMFQTLQSPEKGDTFCQSKHSLRLYMKMFVLTFYFMYPSHL